MPLFTYNGTDTWLDTFPAGGAPVDGSAITIGSTAYKVARLSRSVDGLSLTADLMVV